MLLRLPASAVVVVAAVSLGTTGAHASAVQPAAHHFVKGEHFRYTEALSLGAGEGVVVIGGPRTMMSVGDIEVVEVSASATMLADHVQYNNATDLPPRTRYFRVSAAGAWRYADGRIEANVVTWDSVQFGPQPSALAVGQHWQVDVARTASFEPGRAVVRVVSVDPDNLVLHVDGTQAPSRRGPIRVTHTWSADVTFAHGIVRDLHRVDREHWEYGPGMRAFDNLTDRRVRLIAQPAP